MVISLRRQEDIGMHIENRGTYSGNNYSDIAQMYFKEHFGNRMQLVDQWSASKGEGMGAFYLEYVYLPKGFKVILDCQKMIFSISLKDRFGGEISLISVCEKILYSDYGKSWDDVDLNESNLRNAISELSVALNEKCDKIFFYLFKDDKIYIEKDGSVEFLQEQNGPFCI